MSRFLNERLSRYRRSSASAALLLALTTASAVHAQTTDYSAVWEDGWTVTPTSRQRIGANTSTDAAMRLGGTGTAGARSYTVMDFNAAAFGIGSTITDVESVTLSFVTNGLSGGISPTGTLELFLAGNGTAVDPPAGITYGTTSSFEPNGIRGVGAFSYGTLFSLGTLTLPQVPSAGQAVSLALSGAALSAAGEQFLVDSLNSGSGLRLILASSDTTSQARYGVDLTNAANRPTLTVTAGSPAAAVPEPGAGVLVLFGGLGAVVARRRRVRTIGSESARAV